MEKGFTAIFAAIGRQTDSFKLKITTISTQMRAGIFDDARNHFYGAA
jgi:hypothetical protein